MIQKKMLGLVPTISDVPNKTLDDAQKYPVTRVVVMNPIAF